MTNLKVIIKDLVGLEFNTKTASQYLGVEEAVVKAVAEVESAGKAFFDGKQPTILYERHIFHRLTNGIFSAKHPDISNKTAGGYGKTGQHQHDRLAKAVKLDRSAALQSASWGKFQIMGFHWKALGYKSVQDFINAMYKNEGEHLRAFVKFIQANNLTPYLKKHDWAGFAKRYNGAGYKKNNYDIKLEQAYNKYKNQK